MCGPLRLLIRGADAQKYEDPFTDQAKGGPAWLDDVYEIVAKAEGTPSDEQMRVPMLQALLEERFQLKVHRDEKDVPVYFLVVTKGGAKFQQAKK